MTGGQFADLPEYAELIADDAVPKCPTCGGDPELCGDEDRVWYPHRSVCERDRAQKVAERKWRELNEPMPWHDGTGRGWQKDYSPATPYRYDDGVTISVHPTDLSPGDEFQTKRSG